MRALLLAFSLAAFLPCQSAYPADIEYRVAFRSGPEFSMPDIAKPFSIEVKDRIWVSTGVEESVGHHAAEIETRLSEAVKDEVAPSEVFQVEYGYWRKMQVTVAHRWIGTSLWPLTRERFSTAVAWEKALKAVRDPDFDYVF